MKTTYERITNINILCMKLSYTYKCTFVHSIFKSVWSYIVFLESKSNALLANDVIVIKIDKHVFKLQLLIILQIVKWQNESN